MLFVLNIYLPVQKEKPFKESLLETSFFLFNQESSMPCVPDSSPQSNVNPAAILIKENCSAVCLWLEIGIIISNFLIAGHLWFSGPSQIPNITLWSAWFLWFLRVLYIIIQAFQDHTYMAHNCAEWAESKPSFMMIGWRYFYWNLYYINTHPYNGDVIPMTKIASSSCNILP